MRNAEHIKEFTERKMISMRMTKHLFLEDGFNIDHSPGMIDIYKFLSAKTYRKGNHIHESYNHEKFIYFIKKGYVKIGKKVGDEFVLEYILSKGNIFGESKITEGETSNSYTAVAMSEANICFIEEKRINQLMQECPKFNNLIFKMAGLKFRKIEQRLLDIIHKDAETRIKDFIFDFVIENGKEQEGWLVAKNIFSHSDIGKLTSTSRQTVNNVISKFRKTSELLYDRLEIKIQQNRLS